MSSTHYVKAYYNKSGQSQQEIRRFALDLSPTCDVYADLYTKVALLGSENEASDFSLQYNDEENERITFSTNDELRSAIALNKGSNTLKVFVVAKQAAPQQEAQQQQQSALTNKECHPNVTCDGCQGPVVGFRYKCLVCPNYDLCEKCSIAGIHSEHNMIRMTKPETSPHSMGFPPTMHHDHHRQHWRKHHGHHSRHHHASPSAAPTADVLQQVQAQIAQWLPNRGNSDHFQAHLKQHLDTIKANTATHLQNSKEYLESVGQYLQQTLSPLGIDCDYHVDDKTTTTTASTASTAEQAPEETTTTVTTTAESAPPATPLVNSEAARPVFSNSPLTSVEENNIGNNVAKSLVEECIEKLKAMGFSDAGGALLDLVRVKNGDLNAVLDAINPRRH